MEWIGCWVEGLVSGGAEKKEDKEEGRRKKAAKLDTERGKK